MKTKPTIALVLTLLGSECYAQDTYDPRTQILTIQTLQHQGLQYSNVVIHLDQYSVLSVGDITSPSTTYNNKSCTAANFTTKIANSIKTGMSLDQVSALIGCTNDSSLTMRSSNYVNYFWSLNPGSMMTSLGVFFDGKGETVTPFAGTITSGFGF